ncbi:hypothetical protein AMTR_s00126p00108720 [Amborella trichopoda]|uniref:Uncharacterized protein n=1 Tax=Amborella trichopoda TaxID=13333 RepID=W1NNA2_AMBTC|nr:hypothetical protein AMTR_s00126p00108720 [Amborella trichopoda]
MARGCLGKYSKDGNGLIAKRLTSGSSDLTVWHAINLVRNLLVLEMVKQLQVSEIYSQATNKSCFLFEIVQGEGSKLVRNIRLTSRRIDVITKQQFSN